MKPKKASDSAEFTVENLDLGIKSKSQRKRGIVIILDSTQRNLRERATYDSATWRKPA